ncbi:tRNA1(Val) (adenine(37)-N6)-methyltransferase [Primorskyibacter sp. 2E107]|uniref:tRNA1(Val) (adenine(37)-N6)-methyltransferase n=1 Tax=Primorskyibacter sp. 2E107 TaxID=3403458 RepID=UPI003AF5BFEE
MKADPFAPDALDRSDFLGGKVRIWQPRGGYRAGIDPVLLAASVPAVPGQSVLELGCGAAPALCCLGVRVPGLSLTGVELQPAYADLARRNLAENDLAGEIRTADLLFLPADLRQQAFDHVMANPPYFHEDRRRSAEDAGREIGRAGPAPLEDWVAVAARRLKPGGFVSFIQRVERLPELLGAMNKHLGSLELKPLLPRAGRPPRLVLTRGRKGGRADFRFHPGLVLHRGAAHEGDWDHYSEAARSILRCGENLTFS